MSRAYNFLKQHLSLAVIGAVLVPLVALLVLQYKVLSELEHTSPAARKMSIESRLKHVAEEIDRGYIAEARRSLDLPSTAIIPDSTADDVSHFRNVPSDGVKRFFVASLFEKKRAKITTFDPKTGMADGDGGDSMIFWACYSASVHSLNRMMRPESVDPDAIDIDEKDPRHRIVVKPIVDASSRLVGVAGILVDVDYFRQEYLPRALDASMRAHFSQEELAGLKFTVWDDGGASALAGAQLVEANAEVTVPLRFAFSRWRLGVVPSGPTHEQLARQYFVVTITLSILLTVLVAGALAVTLRAASRELRLSRMKTDFVANVSHELRTPLASIRVFGELLKTGRVGDPVKVREYGDLIETESTRLTQLINNILDFSRIESGRKIYRFSRTNVVDLVEETVRSFAAQARQHGFAIRYVAPTEPLPPVNADPDAVAQALVNLLDNAVKYSGSSRQVDVQLERRKGYVAISVADSGVGIPVDEQKLIFNRFHRASSSLVHDVKGSGLGLALVKHVVESHAGFVTVDSRPAAGSTFTIHLPFDGRGHHALEPGSVAEAAT